MEKRKVLLICHYSNEDLRSHIDQSPLRRANELRRFLKRPDVPNYDVAPWIETFIAGIIKHGNNLELHVMTSCVGMRYKRQDYQSNGVFYHIFNYDLPPFLKVLDKLCKFAEKTDYMIYRKTMSSIIKDVSPDLIVLSGAENPEYSYSVLDHLEIPSLIILQTLLSSPARIKLNVGSPYRRKIEQEIFKRCRFFTFMENDGLDIIKSFNPSAKCFDFEFSTLSPPNYDITEKQFDFVFVSGALYKFKGIEDAIKAFGLFCKKYPHTKMDIIGTCGASYKTELDSLIEVLGISDNVHFEGRYEDKNDMFRQVQKAKIVLLPGITAALNTTVREGMFMRLPIIQYETIASRRINKHKNCIMTAKMENIDDLAEKMIFLYENPDYAKQMADNGYEYANTHFTADAVGKLLVSQIYEVFNTIDDR